MAFVPPLCRYVSGIGAGRTTLLDVNTTTGFKLLRSPDFGTKDIESVKLSQQPYDGDLVVDTRRPNRRVRLALLLQPQETWAEILTLRSGLVTELDRQTNILEYRFPYTEGGVVPEPFFVYTERAPVPALLRGQDAPNPGLWLRDVPILLEFEAQPDFVDTTGSVVPF